MAGQAGSVTALIDGASLPGLAAGIEAAGATALGLFQGQTASRLREVAPYLLQLGKDALMPDGLPGGQFPGILIETSLDLAALCRHFRRFMRIESEGQIYFFRFWDPPTARAYFDAIATSAERGRWFFPRSGGRIDTIFLPDGASGGFRAYRAGPTPASFPWHSRPFRLTAPEMAALSAARLQNGIDQLVVLLSGAFPQIAAEFDSVVFDDMVRRATLRSLDFGIRERANIFRFVAWDLHAHGNFEDTDPGAELGRILISDLGEAEKMHQLIARLAALAPANRPVAATDRT